MTTPYYDYEARRGLHNITWNDFFGICKGLARAASAYQPELILGIIRGGLYPATQLSHLLRVDLHAIRVTRRQHDRVVYDTPQWVVRPPDEVAGKRVLIVDEICSEGLTLQIAREGVEQMGAAQVKTAVMYAHTWGQHIPDYIGLISDELILNPWDREVFVDGQFAVHPEYAHALAQQGVQADSSLLIGVDAYDLAKG